MCAHRPQWTFEQFGSLANFQFSTLAILFSEFDSLVGYRTTEKEG